MEFSKRHFLSYALTFVLFFLFALPSLGQSIWSADTKYESKAGVDILIPSFDLIEADFPTSSFYLFTHYALSEKYTLKVELPISHFSSDGFIGSGSNSETALGNPYFGIRISSSESNLGVDFGIRLPLASEDNSGLFTGLLIENYEVSPFIPESFAFIANADYRYENESGFILNIGGGPEVVAPKNADAELFVKYYGQMLYNIDNVTFGGGLTGQAIITEGDFSFADSSIHNLGIMGSYDFGNVALGSYLRFPLDDGLNDIIDYVLGVNATLSL